MCGVRLPWWRRAGIFFSTRELRLRRAHGAGARAVSGVCAHCRNVRHAKWGRTRREKRTLLSMAPLIGSSTRSRRSQRAEFALRAPVSTPASLRAVRSVPSLQVPHLRALVSGGHGCAARAVVRGACGARGCRVAPCGSRIGEPRLRRHASRASRHQSIASLVRAYVMACTIFVGMRRETVVVRLGSLCCRWS